MPAKDKEKFAKDKIARVLGIIGILISALSLINSVLSSWHVGKIQAAYYYDYDEEKLITQIENRGYRPIKNIQVGFRSRDCALAEFVIDVETSPPAPIEVAASGPKMLRPINRTSPSWRKLGTRSFSRFRVLSNVLLPQPLGPIIAVTLVSRNQQVISFRICLWPNQVDRSTVSIV